MCPCPVPASSHISAFPFPSSTKSIPTMSLVLVELSPLLLSPVCRKNLRLLSYSLPFVPTVFLADQHSATYLGSINSSRAGSLAQCVMVFCCCKMATLSSLPTTALTKNHGGLDHILRRTFKKYTPSITFWQQSPSKWAEELSLLLLVPSFLTSCFILYMRMAFNIKAV